MLFDDGRAPLDSAATQDTLKDKAGTKDMSLLPNIDADSFIAELQGDVGSQTPGRGHLLNLMKDAINKWDDFKIFVDSI